MSCNYCFASTQTGGKCKRLASCKLGCKYYCFQHVQMHGGKYKKGEKCKEKLKKCPFIRDKVHKSDFPCKRANTVFTRVSEWKEYRNLWKSKKKSRQAIKKTREYKGYKDFPKKSNSIKKCPSIHAKIHKSDFPCKRGRTLFTKVSDWKKYRIKYKKSLKHV